MLAELATRLSPWGHARFERRCVDAVLGDLPPEQLTKLEKHLSGCAKCSRFLAGTAQSSFAAMPGFWGKRKPVVSMIPPKGILAPFLHRFNFAEHEQKDNSL